jgi:hypothetical protein
MAYDGTTLTWQNEVHTNRIYKIAVGTELVPPDVSEIPLGGRMDWTDNESGGAADGYDVMDVYLTDDDIAIEAVEEDGMEINPPTAPGVIAIIRDKVGIRKVTFTSAEVGAKLLQYATNQIEIDPVTGAASPGSGIWIETQEHSRVSLAIEVLGLGILCCLSVEIKAMPMTGNVKAAATQEVAVDVFRVTWPSTAPIKTTNMFLEYKAE